VIQGRALSKSFDGVKALDGVSFDIARSSITAILGPNASGKSTLIKSILGLVRPDSGSILIDGEPVLGLSEYRRQIGYMPQQARFPENLRAGEIVSMLSDMRGFREPPDNELIRLFGIENLGSKPVRALSGGTRQKLNAAVALMFKPSLLILDEPTSGLDPVSNAILKEKICREQENGATVILTSHNLHELDEVASHVLFLLEGRVCFDGPLSELKENTGAASLERAVVTLMEISR
jgi:Cu-processing system ATP-binding protein